MLTDEHRGWLEEHGVDIDLAERLGVRSVEEPLPGVIFPWTSPDGRESFQLHPNEPRMGPDGRVNKYLSKKGATPVLWAVRHLPDATKILIVEGSKQCLVAAMYAPPDFAVYGVAGCWGFRDDGVPITDLEIADGREVCVIYDADAGRNPDVYDAAEALGAALDIEGAASVSWVRMIESGAGGKSGLDDFLVKKDADRRASCLARLIAKAKDKVADNRPKARSQPTGKVVTNPDPDRPLVNVEDDPLLVTDKIERCLRRRWDAKTIYCYGEELSELVNGNRMRALTRHHFTDLVIKTVTPVVEVRGQRIYQMPSPTLMGAIQTPRAQAFTHLDRLGALPLFRFSDGSIHLEPGYDTASRTCLIDDPYLEKVEVPDNPDAEDVARAVHLLDEWFCDVPFPDAASRANVKALVLTYFIRDEVARVPLAVINGLQAGSGKGLIANCISLVVRGKPATLRSFSESDEENRKALLAAYRAGESAVTWDEAHRLHGANLAQALTEPVRTDRILGVSDEVSFENRMVWTALGNQVQVVGDIERRCYPIHVVPTGPNPEDRPEESFLHPQLEDWTLRHRAELVSACLTLIRAWWQAGSPMERTDFGFGSFEGWQRIIGGILAHAKIPGFLGNIKEWRKSANLEAHQWTAHMEGLVEAFGELPFTTRQVKEQAFANLAEYEGPPGMQDIAGAGYSQELGKAYKRRVGVWCAGYKLMTVGTAHGGAHKWQLVPFGGNQPGSHDPSPSPDLPGPSDSSPDDGKSGVNGDNNRVFTPATGARVRAGARATRGRAREGLKHPSIPTVDTTPTDEEVIFDLETGSATELYSTPRGEFVRIGGYADPARPDEVTVTTDWAALAEKLRAAKVVSGHNIMGFDLQALTRHHDGPDIQELAREGRAFDTLLAARHLDPPMARDKGVDAQRRHDLDSLGKRYFGEDAGKAGNLKALAKKHGGFDKIPLDDEDYLRYLRRDVTLNALVYQRQRDELAAQGEKSQAYLAREHRVAAVAAQISLNGFRVDLDVLQQRLDHNERLRTAALNRLHDRYDIPLTDDKGKPYKSPLATDAGREALCAALVKHGLKEGAWWTTEKSRDIALSASAMKYLYNSFHHIPQVRDMARMVITVVGLRSVYSTVAKNLVGDRVHCSVSMKQSTGRWSLTRPGLTVFGKRGERFHEREIFAAEPGHVIIAVDLSQVDMRALAGLSGDEAYINLFRSGEDPHAEIARLLFGDPTMREVAKPIGHGWNYGRGIKAISDDNEIEPKLVRQFDAQMRERFPRLVEWQGEVRAWAESGELLDNGWGRPMRPDPRRAHTQGPALMGQGGARDIMCEGLLRLPAEVLPMLRAQVHDEVVLSVPAADAHDIQQVVIGALSFDWHSPSGKIVPIVAEGGPCDRRSWGDVYRKGDQ